MKSKKLNQVLTDIDHYFHFLFDRGFRIYSSKDLPMGDWQVTLTLDNCGLVVYSDQGEIGVIFTPMDSNFEYRVGLEAMIYFLSQEEVFLGKAKKGVLDTRQEAFENLSALVRNYLEQILPYFRKDYERYKPEILLIQKKYLDIYLDKYVPK